MSLKKLLLSVSALALLASSAAADGGPVPEPPAPPPEPVAPPPEPEPAPPPPPAEEPFKDWYLAAHGGAVWADDFRREIIDFGVIETDLDVGWGAGGAIGHRWENGWRAELEATWRHNSGEIIFPGQRLNVFDLDLDSLSVMFNVLHDFDIDTFFRPYLGVGVGASFVTMDIEGLGEDDGWGLAYQFLGGFSVPMPNTDFELFVDYRYLGTTGFGLGPFEEKDEYRTQNVFGGLRFYF
jgi:opacity protein-like surface antigen